MSQNRPEYFPRPDPHRIHAPRSASIRSAFSISLLMFVVLWAGLYFHLTHDEEQTLGNARKQAQNLALAFSEHVVGTLRTYEQMIHEIALDFATNPREFKPTAALVQHATLGHHAILVSVIGPDGYLRFTSQPVAPGPRMFLGDREHFQVHVDNREVGLFVSKPTVGRVSGRTSIQLSRRLEGIDGSFTGVIVLSIDPDRFSEFFRKVDMGPNDVIAVVGHDMVMRARATGSGDTTVGGSLKGTEFEAVLAAAPSGTFEASTRMDGGQRLYGYKSLEEFRLAVIFGLSREDVLATHNERRSILIASAFTISLILGLATYYLITQLQLQRAYQEALRQREAQLVESYREVELANRSKTEFLANMSHELRTPLNAIIGFSEIIRDRLFGPSQMDRYAEYANDIYTSGQHLLTLISDILDMSKIEAGRYELDFGQVDIVACINFCETLMRPRATAGHVAMQMELDPDLPDIEADERAIKQVLLNLMSNAVKFTPEGGMVRVTATATEPSLVIRVSDTGIGISEEDLPRVMEPFQQASTGMNRAHEGTGLGLAITRRIVEMHDGTISIESAVGKGTTVTITLPLHRPTVSPPGRLADGAQ